MLTIFLRVYFALSVEFLLSLDFAVEIALDFFILHYGARFAVAAPTFMTGVLAGNRRLTLPFDRAAFRQAKRKT